jgi:short-subunit dehydrogenase
MKLKGKTAVIVGAGGGIGREITFALAKKGANLVLVKRKRGIAEVLKKKSKKLGGRIDTFSCDLTKPKSIDRLARRIRSKYENIDLLFHAAGVGVYKGLDDISLEEWNRSFEVNVTAVFYLTKKLLPLLKKSKRSYVFALGSGMGKIAVSGRAPYCASKFALRGLMLSLAKEYRATNVKFVLFTMGSIMTPFGPLTVEEKKQKEKRGKRYLDPKWLAGYIVAKIRNNTLDSEVSIYPKRYLEESRKTRRTK